MDRMTFSGVGKYNLPKVPKFSVKEYEPCFEAPFNYINSIKGIEARQKYLLHFYIDDYHFKRVWERPDYYIYGLKQYRYVVMPDFSTYLDWPFPIRLYNHFKNRWLAAYFAMHGVKVIPNIRWGTPAEYSMFFIGMPKGGVYACSSVGVGDTARNIERFTAGFNEFVKVLKPDLVLMHGRTFDGMADCRIESITRFTDRLEARRNV